jgi:hypothetical protein
MQIWQDARLLILLFLAVAKASDPQRAPDAYPTFLNRRRRNLGMSVIVFPCTSQSSCSSRTSSIFDRFGWGGRHFLFLVLGCSRLKSMSGMNVWSWPCSCELLRNVAASLSPRARTDARPSTPRHVPGATSVFLRHCDIYFWMAVRVPRVRLTPPTK